jgi:hypothetical protein
MQTQNANTYKWSTLTFEQQHRDPSATSQIQEMLRDTDFIQHFDLNVNICKYIGYARRGMYDSVRVCQSLARIVNAYHRKKRNYLTIDDIKMLAYNFEYIVRKQVLDGARL